MKSRPKPPNTPSTEPAKNADGVPLARVRRVPNPLAFLFVGGILGAIVGLVLSRLGDDGSYQGGSASAYFVALFAGLGLLAGGVVFAILDRRS